MHAALRVALRHFLVHDAAAGGHPLHVAGAEIAAIAQAVAVLDIAGQHISNGLDAAMRMPGKAGAIILRPVVAEIVEQQERIGGVGFAEAERAAQLYAGALDRGLRRDDLLHGPDGHDFCPFRWLNSRQKMVSRRKPARRHIFDTGQLGPSGPPRRQLWIYFSRLVDRCAITRRPACRFAQSSGSSTASCRGPGS